MKKLIFILFIVTHAQINLYAEFVVGVWNIEKLSSTSMRGFPELRGGDQHSPRTDSQLEDVADYIADTLEIDALVITEIDDDGGNDPLRPRSAQLDVVLGHLGSNWSYFLGRTGGDLRIGLLFNGDRVRVKRIVGLRAPEFEVQGEDIFDRDPMLFWVSFLDNGQETSDVLLVGLHLKSQQFHTHNHLAAMSKVIGDLKTPDVREDLGLPRRQDGEDDVIILGDLNDSTHTRQGFRFIFDYAESQGYIHAGGDLPDYPATRVNGSEIDHIFLSRDVVRDLLVSGSFTVHTVPDNERDSYRETFSDHYPVTVELKSKIDDD